MPEIVYSDAGIDYTFFWLPPELSSRTWQDVRQKKVAIQREF